MQVLKSATILFFGVLATATVAVAQNNRLPTCCCPGTGTWKLLDKNAVIKDFNAFAAFANDHGYPIHPTGGEINTGLRTYYLGMTERGGVDQTIVGQYIAFKFPNTQYCEFFARPRNRFCPPQGGVLFIQPAPVNPGDPIPPGGGYLRSESDTVDCPPPASPACPRIPGACWAIEFSDSTVGEIWVR